MSGLGFVLVVLAGLIAYEAIKGLHPATVQAAAGPSASGGSGATGAQSSAPTPGLTAGLQNQSMWQSLLAQPNLGLSLAVQQQFLTIINRESGGIPAAPGKVTGNILNWDGKSHDGRAWGGFQFLPTTWMSYGCTGTPTNPADAVACAAKAYHMNGFSDWNASA